MIAGDSPSDTRKKADTTSEGASRSSVPRTELFTASLDSDGRITVLNDSFERYLGYEPGHLSGSRAARIFPKDDLEWLTRSLNETDTAGLSFAGRVIHIGGWLEPMALTATLLREPSGQSGMTIRSTDRIPQADLYKAIERSQRRLRALVQNSPVVISVLDRDGFWLESSDAGSRLAGYPKGFDPEDGIISLLHEDDLEIAQKALDEVISGTRSPQEPVEFRIRAADGQLRTFENFGQNLLDDDSVNGVVVWSHDVSERKEAEEALRQSRERYRALVEAAPIMVFTLSPDGVTKSVNRTFESITGWSRADWTGKHFAPLVHADDLSRSLNRVERIARGEPGEPYDVRIVTKAGHYLTVESTVVPLIVQGEVVEILGIGRDVTEQRRTEAWIRERVEQFRHIFQHAPVGLAVVGADGLISDVNDALTHFLGRTGEELIGTSLRSYVHSDDLDIDTTLIGELSAGAIPSFQVEKRCITGDGAVVFGDMTVSQIKNALGEILYEFHIVEDVTERKRLEGEVAEQAAQATSVLSKLTPREAEILTLLGGTESVPEVAAQLSVSARTVESHIANAYRKLGVRTRSDALAEFARLNDAVVATYQKHFPIAAAGTPRR